MEAVFEDLAEIDTCASLYLREISEPKQNVLRLLIEEVAWRVGRSGFVVGEEGQQSEVAGPCRGADFECRDKFCEGLCVVHEGIVRGRRDSCLSRSRAVVNRALQAVT